MNEKCAQCKHHDVFWDGEGCSLLNNTENCKFEPKDDAEKPKKEKKCLHCRFCRGVYTNGGFQFLGCYHQPYHGKWVAEIKECPKEKER